MANVQAEIPFGSVEYTIRFKNPILGVWHDLTPLITSVLIALEPFGFNVDGVEIKRQEKLSDNVLTFKRGKTPAFSFSITVGKMWFYAENLDWSEAEQTIRCINEGTSAVRKESKFEQVSQQILLNMHVQIKDKPISELTAPLLAKPALGLLDGDVKCHGIILLREKGSVILDGSAAFANAIFVRIIREHAADTPLQQIANELLQDEKHLFDTLGITSEL